MSKETKFTKGEWLIDKDSHLDGYWGISVKTDGFEHYHFVEVVFKMDGEVKNKRLEANAHLIKTAPKLYETLRAISEGEGLQPGTTIERLLAEARGE